VSAESWPASLHLIGSKGLGGAERWADRFAGALAECGAPAAVGVRAGSAVEQLCFGGLPVHRLPFLTVWDPLSRQAVRRLVRTLKPDVVQTYMGRATRLARLGGRPVHVARLGGYYSLGPYRHADAWIANTRGLRDWMIAGGLPAQRVHHIYNFAQPAEPRPARQIDALRASLDIPDDALVLLTPARLVPVKGHAGLLDAAALLPAEIAGRRWRLVLLGDGPLQQVLARRAQSNGVAERLVWAGWQPAPGAFLQMADLVVFPSRDAETLGNVILEAWAWRRPLVVTRFRGARELVRHGEDAWSVPCDDPPALAEGIKRVLGDAELRAGMSARGSERIARDFAREIIMGQYRDLYARLAGG
jgi:glycosyltransferase involved in cell wall biosynthesis